MFYLKSKTMLNRKLAKAGSVLVILFFSVLKVNAGFNPVYLTAPFYSIPANNNDTTSVVDFSKPEKYAPEIPLHPSMENFVADYGESNEEFFDKLKANKSYYFKTIDKIFLQYNVPVELKYLAVIESKLNTNAVSRVGAVGMWQFMPSTAKLFGLKVSRKYDERRHFWKSSVAAAKYLKELYDLFGDWQLVIAAYNSGPAPVLSAIKKTGSRSFWRIQYLLPKETRLHVKRYIATHYYFEGGGSLATLGKSETEKYLRELDEFNSKSEPEDQQDQTINLFASQWVAIVSNEKDLKLVLKK